MFGYCLFCPGHLLLGVHLIQYSQFYDGHYNHNFNIPCDVANENSESFLSCENHALGLMMKKKSAFKSPVWMYLCILAF